MSLRPRQNIAILGATGSIGLSTLDVVARHPEQFRVYAVTAHQRLDDLIAICKTHQPVHAVIAAALDPSALDAMRIKLALVSPQTVLTAGADALCAVAADTNVDVVMAAIVGAAGLAATIAAARAGKRLLLANKEAIVMGGALFMDAVKLGGATLLPIDSEHNAIFQCLPQSDGRTSATTRGVRRILLTGSGGPFRRRPIAELEHVTPDEACAHPTWSMGRKISVDSATMMNKALEIIEARWLFNLAPEQINVVVHPQSVVHSMVEYDDGSVLAQLGNPDMRTPIAHALAFPDRITAGVAPLDLCAIAQLTFEPPDFERFPALRLAYEVLAAGGTAAAVFNAANEVAVASFLAGEIRFTAITDIIAATLAQVAPTHPDTLADVLLADASARHCATQQINYLRISATAAAARQRGVASA